MLQWGHMAEIPMNVACSRCRFVSAWNWPCPGTIHWIYHDFKTWWPNICFLFISGGQTFILCDLCQWGPSIAFFVFLVAIIVIVPFMATRYNLRQHGLATPQIAIDGVQVPYIYSHYYHQFKKSGGQQYVFFYSWWPEIHSLLFPGW